MSSVKQIARAVRAAGRAAAQATHAERNEALRVMSEALSANRGRIEEANKLDIEKSKSDPEVGEAMLARLAFNGNKIEAGIAGLNDLQKLADPIGSVQLHRELSPGLELKRITVPLGVLGIIFEARPDAAVQIGSLAVKSGNGVLLKCGREAVGTCTEIVDVFKTALKNSPISPDAIALLVNREQTAEMLTCHDDIDLIIPRGSNSFVQYVQKSTTIPVLGHADGICHVYVDAKADLTKALDICIDSKTQYPSACNSMETLLVHESVAAEFLPKFFSSAKELGVVMHGCDKTMQIASTAGAEVLPVETFKIEFCALECNIKVVSSTQEAINHVNEFGSKHTDCIVSEDNSAAHAFQASVSSAGAFHNCSTRFADGFRYGFGAEVGVSTSTMPPRGPVGLEGIVTYKYFISSTSSHTVSEFSSGAKAFTHRDLI
ncbi:Gamma-glutamyl phosphate reductase [Diplonema papillatum]|nr:Gamma-glutamyl phosphate reductase [Diplonema papillatum]